MSASNSAAVMCSLLRTDIFFRAVERGDSVLLDKLTRLGGATGYVLQDSSDGTTLLHLAAGLDPSPTDYIRGLLDHGADPNAATADGVTALHIAAACGNQASLLTLLEAGGDPRLHDGNGNDVFDLLLDSGHLECLLRVRPFFGLPVSPPDSDAEESAKGHSLRSSSAASTPALSPASDAAPTSKGVKRRSDSLEPSPATNCSDSDVSDAAEVDHDGGHLEDTPTVLLSPDCSDVSSDTESLLNTAYVFPHPYMSPAYTEAPRRRRRHHVRATDDEADSMDSSSAGGGYDSATSSASSNVPPELLRLSNSELRERLVSYREDGGPVTDFNRSLNLHKLAHLEMGREARIRLCEPLFVQPDSTFASDANSDFCEVVHEDPDNGLALKETHHPSSDAEVLTSGRSSPDAPVVPVDMQKLTNDQVFERLKQLGDDPGPVTDATRQVYLRRLARATSERSLKTSRDVLPPDVHFLVANVAKALDAYEALEREMVLDFETPRPEGHWREGNSKTSFNYLLLDSRVTRNLPVRARGLPLAEQVSDFVRGVFYVGKGKRSRPFSHLHDALVVWNGTAKAWQTAGDKTRKVLQIWEAGCGVVSLHVFQNVLPAEAYTREACIIEALTKRRLTNAKKGDCYGVVGSWSEKARKKLGAFLVFKAFQIFLSEGERRLGPLDL
ncbi:ankyrin repeat and LEM domain-containing protein 1-like [Ixodes scapularis]